MPDDLDEDVGAVNCLEKQKQIMLIDLRRFGFEGSNPKESLDTTWQGISDTGPDFAYKTFFGVGSLEIQGSNPEESLALPAKTCLTGTDFACKTFFGVGSL